MARRKLGHIIRGLWNKNKNAFNFANNRRDEVLESLLNQQDNIRTEDLEENNEKNMENLAKIAYETDNVTQMRNRLLFVINNLTKLIEENANDYNIEELKARLENSKNALDSFDKEVEVIRKNEPDIINQVDKLLIEAFENDLEEKLKNRFEKMKYYAENFALTEQRELELALEVNEFIENENLDPTEKETIRIKLMGKYEKKINEELGTENLDFIEKYAPKFYKYVDDLETLAPNSEQFEKSYKSLIDLIEEMKENDLGIRVTFDENTQNLSIKYPDEKIRNIYIQIVPDAYISLVNGESVLDGPTQKEKDKSKLTSKFNEVFGRYLTEIKKMLRGEKYNEEIIYDREKIISQFIEEEKISLSIIEINELYFNYSESMAQELDQIYGEDFTDFFVSKLFDKLDMLKDLIVENTYEYDTEEFNDEYNNIHGYIEELKEDLNQDEDYKKFINSIDFDEESQTLRIRFKGTAPNYERQIVSNEILEKMQNEEKRTLRKSAPASNSARTQNSTQHAPSFNQQPPLRQSQAFSGQPFQSGTDFSQPSSSQMNTTQPQPDLAPIVTQEEQLAIENYLNGIEEINNIVELINELNVNLISQVIYNDIDVAQAQRIIELEQQAKDLDQQLINLKIDLSKERLHFKQRFNKYITSIPEVKEKTINEIYFDGNLNDFIRQHDEMMVETEGKILDLDEERKMYPDNASEITKEIDVLLKFIESQNSLIGRRLVNESKNDQSLDLVNTLKVRRENKKDMRNRLRAIKNDNKNYQTQEAEHFIDPLSVTQEENSYDTNSILQEKYEEEIKSILEKSVEKAVMQVRKDPYPLIRAFGLDDEDREKIQDIEKKQIYNSLDKENIYQSLFDDMENKFMRIISIENIASHFQLIKDIEKFFKQITEQDMNEENFEEELPSRVRDFIYSNNSLLMNHVEIYINLETNTCEIDINCLVYDFEQEQFTNQNANYNIKVLAEDLLSVYQNKKKEVDDHLQEQEIEQLSQKDNEEKIAQRYEIALNDVFNRYLRKIVDQARKLEFIPTFKVEEDTETKSNIDRLIALIDEENVNIDKQTIYNQVYFEYKNKFNDIIDKELTIERSSLIQNINAFLNSITIVDVENVNFELNVKNRLNSILSQYDRLKNNTVFRFEWEKNKWSIDTTCDIYNFSLEKTEKKVITDTINAVLAPELLIAWQRTAQTIAQPSISNAPIEEKTTSIEEEYTAKLHKLFDNELKRLVEEGRNLSPLVYKKSYFSDIATDLNSQYDFALIDSIYTKEVEYYDNLLKKIRKEEKQENLRAVNSILVNYFHSRDKKITKEELETEMSNMVNMLKNDWKVNITNFTFDTDTNSYTLTCNEAVYNFQKGTYEPQDRVFTQDNLLKEYILKELQNSLNPEQETSTPKNTRLEQIKEEYTQKLKNIYKTELSNRKSTILDRHIKENYGYLRQSLQALKEEYKTEFMDEEIADTLRNVEKEYKKLYTEIVEREQIVALEYIRDQFNKIGIDDSENLEEKIEEARTKILKNVHLTNLKIITDLEHNSCLIQYRGEVYNFDENTFETRNIEIEINELIFSYIVEHYLKIKKQNMQSTAEEMEQKPSIEENRKKYRKELRENFTEKLKDYIDNVRKGNGNGSTNPFKNSMSSSLIEESFRDIYEEEVKEFDKTYQNILYTEQISALHILRNEIYTNLYVFGDENKPNFKENLLNKLNKIKNKFVDHFQNLEVIPDLANNRYVIKYYGKKYNFENSTFEAEAITSIEKLFPDDAFERIKKSQPENTQLNKDEYRALLQKVLDAELEMHIKNIKEGKYSLQEIYNIDFKSTIYDTQKIPGDKDYVVNVLNKMQKTLLEKINQKFKQIIETEKLGYLTEIREEINKIEVPQNLENFDEFKEFINKSLKEIENRYKDKCKGLMLEYKNEENSCVIGYESMIWNFEKNEFDEWGINGGIVDNLVPNPIYQYYQKLKQPEVTIEARNLTFNPKNLAKITSNYSNLIITGDALTISLIKNGIKIKYSENLKDKLSQLNAKLSLINKNEKKGRKTEKNIDVYTDEQEMTISSKKEFKPEDYTIKIHIPDGNKKIPLYEYDLENVSEELKSRRR